MRVFCLLCFVLCASIGKGQLFQADKPDQSVEVPLYLATEVWVYFENLGFDTLQLRWRKMQENVPAEWNVDICDYGSCYTGVPASAYMNPAPPEALSFLKLIVQPDDNEGEGYYWFRIYNAADESEFLDISITLTTPGVVSPIQQIVSSTGLSVFPNPAHEFLHLRVDDDHHLHEAWIFNTSGQCFWHGCLSSITTILDTAPWPSGVYILTSSIGNQNIILQH